MYDKSYDDIEFAKSKVLEFMDNNHFNTLPSVRFMRHMGYKVLAYVIERKHGGVVKFRELIDAPPLRVRRGKWESLEFRVAMARLAIQSADAKTLPSKSKLNEIGFSSLAYAISKYDKGFRNFRKILKEKDRGEEIKRYDDINYGIQVAGQIKNIYGIKMLPGDKRLREMGYSTLAYCIYKKYGGRKKFRQMLGEVENKREIGLLKNIYYVRKEVANIMKIHNLTRFPTKEELSKIDSSLAHAIVKNFGYVSFRKTFENQNHCI